MISKQLSFNAIKKIERKLSGKGAFRAGKGFTLFISNEDINGIIKIIKSLEDSNILIDGITETVKYEIKQPEEFLPVLLTPSASSCATSAIIDFFSSKRCKWKTS